MTDEHDFAVRLDELGRWLADHGPLWRERPFIGLPVCWERDEPEVSRALRALPVEVIEAHEAHPHDMPDMPVAFRAWTARARDLSARSPLRSLATLSEDQRPDKVPGRKWRQVVPFVQVVLASRPSEVERWVDWCSGKGHLGRTLSEVTGMPLTCVERDAALCRDGADLASRVRTPTCFIETDVLSAKVAHEGELLGPGVGAVALHACGQLHRELITRAMQRGATYLAVAPCCHHATPHERFVPLSAAARAVPLEIGRHQLRLVGLHEVVASPRRQVLRRREQAWRLGLDLALREATGDDRYRPLGSVPRSWLRSTFEVFCTRLLARAGVDRPRGLDLSGVEARGWGRLTTVRALGLVRGLFRAPLETWLLLDQAQALREQGWSVELGDFCKDDVTPRNGMIVAWRGPARQW